MSKYKRIPGTLGKYQINRNGDVLKVLSGKPNLKIKSRIDRAGYQTVRLNITGVAKTFFVHRLVATTFLDFPLGKTEVNHINGCKTDNRVENLEWVTHAENMQHAFKTGLCQPNGKLVLDKKSGKVYESVRQAAMNFGIKYGTCRNYLNGNIKNNPTTLKLARVISFYDLPYNWHELDNVWGNLDRWKTVRYA